MTTAFLILCLVCFYWDLNRRMIPDLVTIPGALLGMYANFALYGLPGALSSIAGWCLGCLMMLLAGLVCFSVAEKPGVGGGDLKFMAMIGAFWGWKVLLLTYVFAPMLAALWVVTFNRPRLAMAGFYTVGCFCALYLTGSCAP